MRRGNIVTDNTENRINHLNNYINKIIFLLAEDLERLKANKSKPTIRRKKSITNIFSKLVNLLIRLKKLNQHNAASKISMKEEDIENNKGAF